MKNLFFAIIIITAFGCTKETFSPTEQVVEAIHSQLEIVPESPRFYILKNDNLCDQVDCELERFIARGSEVVIYSREDLFMRGIDFFFEVVQWEESPKIFIHNNTRKPITAGLITQKCKGT